MFKMKNIYNNAGDLLVCAYKMMNEGKARKALECAELALKLPSMRVIASGLESMNKIHASDEDLDEDIELEEDIDVEDEESAADDETEENVDVEEDIDVEDEETEAETEEDDEDIDVDLDLEDESDDEVEESEADDEEEEEINEEELDEVLSSLRAQYNVTSSIVTAARKKSKKTKAGCKCGKVKACGSKPSASGSNLPMSTMAKLRGLVNKSAIKAAK
jgi:hypothetical protein